MHSYGVRDVEKLLRLPRSTIRALIEAGFVAPARGPRKAWRFSFQDLIVLRTAQALVAANVPRKRITRSVRELRRHLPQSMPLSGLSICAVADRVVVMTPRPGKIREILPIDLPRPRDLDVRDSPQFTGYTHHIGRLFRELGVIRERQIA